MPVRARKTMRFLSAHPVFTRAEFATAFGRPANSASISSLLKHHLKVGNIKRLSREVFAAVPGHLSAEHLMVDRFAAASKLRPDGVLGYHSALELHGAAYSEFNEVQLISRGRPALADLPFGPCRFVNPPKLLLDAGRTDYLTVAMDRLGLSIKVTAIERTVVDVLHRPDVAGGIKEVLPRQHQRQSCRAGCSTRLRASCAGVPAAARLHAPPHWWNDSARSQRRQTGSWPAPV